MSEPAKNNAHIPTAEIEQDILDTEREIQTLEREAAHLEVTPHTSSALKMNFFRASAMRTGIRDRKQFIEHCGEILRERAGEK